MNWKWAWLMGGCLLIGLPLTLPGREQPQRPQNPPRGPDPVRLLEKFDKNKDGYLDRTEVPEQVKLRFDQIDLNKDGKLSKEEMQKVLPRLAGLGGKGDRPGEVNTPPAKGERYKDSLQVGDPAPDFKLPDPSGKKEVTLSSFRGKKPVVLIFGSYT